MFGNQRAMACDRDNNQMAPKRPETPGGDGMKIGLFWFAALRKTPVIWFSPPLWYLLTSDFLETSIASHTERWELTTLSCRGQMGKPECEGNPCKDSRQLPGTACHLLPPRQHHAAASGGGRVLQGLPSSLHPHPCGCMRDLLPLSLAQQPLVEMLFSFRQMSSLGRDTPP